MPVYEYRCPNCGGLVQVLVRSYADVPACPECGCPLVRGKLFSAPHVLSSAATRPAGRTCCGREERCGTSPCSNGGGCRHG